MDFLTNLIAYWKLNEASGSRADSHSNGLTLSDNNTVGSITGAASFTTTDADYLSRADNPLLDFGTGDFTLAFEFALKTGALNATENVIRKWSPGYVVQFKSSNREIQFYTNDGTTATVLGTNAIPNDTNWHLCVVTRSGATGKIYIDNVDKTTSGATRSGNIDATDTFKLSSVGSEGYNNYLRKVGVWKGEAFDAAKVSALWNGGAVLAYEDFASGTDVTVQPAAQVATFTLPQITVATETTLNSGVGVLTFSTPSPSIIISKRITPSALVATFTVPPYTVVAGGDRTVNVSAQVLTFSIPAYSVKRGATVSVSTQSATFTVPSYSVATLASVIVSVITQSLTFIVPALARIGGVWTKRARQTDSNWTKTPANDN